MLWLALRFPSLPLEVYARTVQSPSPLAITTGSGLQADVLACNDAATERGITPGMSLAAAMALDGGLQAVPRNSAAEKSALERIAAWATQFTPVVSLASGQEILLEIAGSLRLFGGLNALLRLVTTGLGDLGYASQMACAPTPLAALWFARAGLSVRLHHPDTLQDALSKLPIDVLGLPPDQERLLDTVGARTLGSCFELPRDAFARRLSQKTLHDFDRALGKLPDPRPGYVPPARYRAEQPLPAPASEAHMLLFVAKRLLGELCGYLTATGNGVQQLRLTLDHEHHAATVLTLSLMEASRDADHLTSVLRERLAATDLPCAVTGIALESELALPLPSRNLSFLPAPPEFQEAATQLIERLSARLGGEAVQQLCTSADYRPERAWAVCRPGRAARAKKPAVLPPAWRRPLWLLPKPQRLPEVAGTPTSRHGRLALLTSEERIESGWWDGEDVARDYFIASDPEQSLLWVYRERRPDGNWYLHGFFA